MSTFPQPAISKSDPTGADWVGRQTGLMVEVKESFSGSFTRAMSWGWTSLAKS